MRWLLLAALLSGCFNPSYSDDTLCSSAGDCPPGRTCIGGFCCGGQGPLCCGTACSACAAAATCVPLEGGTLTAGVTVPADQECPPGFQGGETLLHRGSAGGSCMGCSCVPGATTCSASLYYYGAAADCTGDTGLTGGTYWGTVDATCPTTPNFQSTLYGMRAVITPTSSCTPGGTATPEWAEVTKFCRASATGTGCQTDEACVPTQIASAQCALAEGSATCATFGAVESDWYTDSSDTRTCDTCACTATGGGCGDMAINIGSDWVCTDTYAIHDAQKQCQSSYAPPARTEGPPTDPTSCTADSVLSGSLDTIGHWTLCCAP